MRVFPQRTASRLELGNARWAEPGQRSDRIGHLAWAQHEHAHQAQRRRLEEYLP